MLKEKFISLSRNYINDIYVINEFWSEIEGEYSEKNRCYHNLSHLENVYNQLVEVKDEVLNWETVLFSLFYHDIVYDVLSADNEEKSSKYAAQRMKQMNVPDDIIENCTLQILATKGHIFNSNSDVNYFIDADLSILGMSFETYLEYAKNVRQEYAIYSESEYNFGRKRVLKHFLEMEKIFKTDYFCGKFELKAKENLRREYNTI